jgi:abortive infection protein
MKKSIVYQLLLLSFLSISGFVISAILYSILVNTPLDSNTSLKITQLLQEILVFGLPAILAWRRLSGNPIKALLTNTIDIKSIIIAIIFIITIIPCIDILSQWNKSLHLPYFLRELENSMIALEQQANNITETMLSVSTIWGLIANIVVIAFAAAICEELFFRGGVQRILAGAFNYHIAVWLTAILFSAIHLQFGGFIPRLILGVSFGYIAIWSRSLYPSIIAHFINNGIAVLSFFLSYNKIIDIPTENFGICTGIISLIISGIVLVYFKRYHYKTAKRITD